MSISNPLERTLATELVAFVKEECPVCRMVEPVLHALDARMPLRVYSQDHSDFPATVRNQIFDSTLEQSFRNDIQFVPTLIRIENGKEVGRAVGWHKEEWRTLAEDSALGDHLPGMTPGCGSKTVEPGIDEHLRVRFGNAQFAARQLEISEWEDPIENAFERGWTDGLPVTPPTRERVLKMLEGTPLAPGQIVGEIPPNLSPCTVEKVAINAVMAGCKPEYMPVVLASVEAALDPLFTLHGLVCTTCFSSPIIVVNGPIAKRIGMNSGMNCLGQGNRANATIGRALNLIVRNVGGGIPGVIDRATQGAPSKYTLCFAENEDDPSWQNLAESRGAPAGSNAVTLFQGEGVFGCTDQRSRTPEEMINSYAMSLAAVGHPKLALWCNALLVMSPEHHGIFRAQGWDRQDIQTALEKKLRRCADDLIQGAQGVGEGVSKKYAGQTIDKFPEGGLVITRAGGEAGLYSAILPGWTGGRFVAESQTVTKVIEE